MTDSLFVGLVLTSRLAESTGCIDCFGYVPQRLYPDRDKNDILVLESQVSIASSFWRRYRATEDRLDAWHL